MKDVINGFVYSYINHHGVERLAMFTFGTSRNKARRKLYADSFNKNLEPLASFKLWRVEIKPIEPEEIK